MIETTLITKEWLTANGYLYKAEELTPEELEEHPDPFYYFKGEFRIYDVIDKFYVDGVAVDTTERLAYLYERYTGRIHSTATVLEDTIAPELKPVIGPVKVGFVKAKLRGGPGDGITVKWPVVSAFFIYQTRNERGQQEGFRYRRKDGTKTIFLYAGPVQ